MKKPSLLLACFLFVLGGVAVAADWPQWRGPNRDDVSKETGLLKTWPEGGPKLLWTFKEAGVGFSTPAIVGDRLYAQGAEGDKDYLFAVDLKTQKKVWSTEVDAMTKDGRGDGPRGTPTVDGELTFAIGGKGNLLCIKTATGEKVWSKNLEKDLGGITTGRQWWGYSESPLVDGEQVVCTPGGKTGAIVALNKKTGEVIWQTSEFTDNAMYSSLVISQACGVRHYVQMTGEHVVGIDPKDGHMLWSIARTGPTAAIPTPIISGNYVYVTSGYKAGCNLLELSKVNGKIEAKEVYNNKQMINHHGGVVLLDGYLYGFSDGKGWVCQELKTGNVAWTEPAKTLSKGCLTYADGHLYCYGEDKGTVVLVEANPKAYKETGRFTIPQESKLPRQQGKFWTHPVVANGKLYLRDLDLIFCYDIKG